MYRVFNMGIGMIAMVAPADAQAVRTAAERVDIETWVIGEIVAGEGVRIG
jgi:phosphoribosylformylglycinamidine cyclo-ligase